MNPKPQVNSENHAGDFLPSLETATPDAAQLPTARMPVDVHSLSLALLTVLAVIFALYWARPFFIPLMFGVMISYALSPLVNWMQKWRIPRAIGAAVLLISIVGGVSSLVYSLSDEVAATIETLPEAAQKFRQTLSKERGTSESAIEKVQKATTEMEQAANDTPIPPPTPPRGVMRVQIEKSKFNIQEYLWAGTM